MESAVGSESVQLMLGDCLERLKELADESVDSIVTDPPYGVDYQSAWRTDKSKWKPKIKNDKAPYIWWLKDAFRVLKVGGALLCFTRYDTENDFRWAMKLAGFMPKAQIIWDKQIHGMGDLKGDFAPQHENIIFANQGKVYFPRQATQERHKGATGGGRKPHAPKRKARGTNGTIDSSNYANWRQSAGPIYGCR
jgi:DNA modification methylase